jgi:quinol monooxygenase YgiN
MSINQVVVLAALKVKSGMEDHAKTVLRRVLSPTRQEQGCLTYDLHQSATDATEFMLYEAWESQEALDAHAASTAEHRLTLRRELATLLDERTRLTFWRRVGEHEMS